jgi:ZIP family zinc transporter/zinc and cadmium transporter
MTGVLFAAFVGLANLAGGLIVLSPRRRSRRLLDALVGFGAGFMLAVVLLEMTPPVVALRGGFIAILAGYLVVHFTQHALTPHFHFGEETHKEAMVSRGVGVWALVGLVPHSFFDGVAIGSGFLTSFDLGFLIALAILLHKVPTGVSLASIMLASGNSRRDALVAVVLVGLTTVLGAMVTPLIAPLAQYGLALAAGVTLYVAASNLIPESQHQHSGLVQGGILAGVVSFVLARALLHALA